MYWKLLFDGNPCREVGGDPPQPALKGREVGGLRSKVEGRTLNVGTHEMRPQAAEVTSSPCTRGAPRYMEPLTVWQYCHTRCCNATCSSVCCCVPSCLAPVLFPPPRAPYCVELYMWFSHHATLFKNTYPIAIQGVTLHSKRVFETLTCH